MKTWKASLALSAVLILAGVNAGCAVSEIRGTVTEMEIEKGKKVCATVEPSSGKSPKCTVLPECYEMEVKEASGWVHEFCIDRASWESYKVGDYFPHKQRN
jgi:hypothetical protein